MGAHAVPGGADRSSEAALGQYTRNTPILRAGLLTASAAMAVIGETRTVKSARQFTAWANVGTVDEYASWDRVRAPI